MKGKGVKKKPADRVFDFAIYFILILLGVLCLAPLLHIVALSFSGRFAVIQGKVGFWPVDFNLSSYEMILTDSMYIRSFFVAFLRVIVGTLINMVFTVLTAYPLSLSKREFPSRDRYMYYTLFTWMFNGGTVAWYLVVKTMGLKGSFWALVIPTALPIYNAILVMNFFRNLPKEMREASMIDGASQFTMLGKIYLPMSKPVLATVCLYCVLNHWNDWFQARLFIDRQEWVPLATYLQALNIDVNGLAELDPAMLEKIEKITTRSYNSAKVIVAMIPVMIIYPFLQKYFVKGITLGAVKG